MRKAIGKKKADLMATLKADFIAGAVGNGCPDYEAEEIWHKIEVAGNIRSTVPMPLHTPLQPIVGHGSRPITPRHSTRWHCNGRTTRRFLR
ncbi:hypothetical protein NXV14_23220 [Bacteroides fragilis]|nr:hypothetical protein [Bacteroides fragilis]